MPTRKGNMIISLVCILGYRLFFCAFFIVILFKLYLKTPDYLISIKQKLNIDFFAWLFCHARPDSVWERMCCGENVGERKEGFNMEDLKKSLLENQEVAVDTFVADKVIEALLEADEVGIASETIEVGRLVFMEVVDIQPNGGISGVEYADVVVQQDKLVSDSVGGAIVPTFTDLRKEKLL